MDTLIINHRLVRAAVLFCFVVVACKIATADAGFGGGGKSSGGFFGRSSSSKSSSPNFSGSYPKQTGVHNPPSYASATGGGGGYRAGGTSYAGGSSPHYGGGASSMPTYVGSASSYGGAQEAKKRISGGNMLAIGAGVAGGVVAGHLISHALFTPSFHGAYYTNSSRYYYDAARDRFYDSKREFYSAEPPCIKPSNNSTTIVITTNNSTAVDNATSAQTTTSPSTLVVVNTTTTVLSNVTLGNQSNEILINGTMPSMDNQWKMYSECLEYFIANKRQLADRYRATHRQPADAASGMMPLPPTGIYAVLFSMLMLLMAT